MEINCPKCGTNNIRKNGHRRGKQNYQCKACGRQFIEFYSPRGYGKEVKEQCLTMYVNGNGFRAIERITKVNHNTVIRWVKQVSNQLPDAKGGQMVDATMIPVPIQHNSAEENEGLLEN